MSILPSSTISRFLETDSSPNEDAEKVKYVDPEGGGEVHPDIMDAIVKYVLSLPPDAERDEHSVVDTPSAVETPSFVENPMTFSTPISQNPYFALIGWKPPPHGSHAPVAPPNWTGVNTYEGFWSTFSNSQYLMQSIANGHANLNPQLQYSATSHNTSLAHPGSQFPFTGTVAPSEAFGPIQSERLPPVSRPRPNTHACRKSSPLKRELTSQYTVQELTEEFPSLAHLIKVVTVKMAASFVCNRTGCGARIRGDPSAIIEHGKKHLHVNQANKVDCIYENCSRNIAVKALGQHIGAHLKCTGAKCGVCREWFTNADLATEHLTQPCAVLLSQCQAEGYPPPRKRRA